MDERSRQAMRRWTLAQPVVSAFVASMVRDFAARDDVLQEVAIAVIESFDRYDANRPFVGWALGIAQNQVRHYWRQRQRDRLVFDDTTLACVASAFESTSVDELRSLDHLHDCLERLDDQARHLCDLRYAQDLKPAAIAASLGMTPNGAAKALQRIRDRLRDCIQRKSAVREVAT